MSVDPGAMIRARRKELKMSLRALAEAAEVSPTMLTGIENGRQRPGVYLAHRILEAVQMPVEDRHAIVEEWAVKAIEEYGAWMAVQHGQKP